MRLLQRLARLFGVLRRDLHRFGAAPRLATHHPPPPSDRDRWHCLESVSCGVRSCNRPLHRNRPSRRCSSWSQRPPAGQRFQQMQAKTFRIRGVHEYRQRAIPVCQIFRPKVSAQNLDARSSGSGISQRDVTLTRSRTSVSSGNCALEQLDEPMGILADAATPNRCGSTKGADVREAVIRVESEGVVTQRDDGNRNRNPSCACNPRPTGSERKLMKRGSGSQPSRARIHPPPTS